MRRAGTLSSVQRCPQGLWGDAGSQPVLCLPVRGGRMCVPAPLATAGARAGHASVPPGAVPVTPVHLTATYDRPWGPAQAAAPPGVRVGNSTSSVRF